MKFKNSLLSLFVLYFIVRKLVTPFKKTDAYKLGIIDEDGKVLRPRKTLKERHELEAYTIFDTLIFNLKKLIQRTVPGRTVISTFTRGLSLLKEDVRYDDSKDAIVGDDKDELEAFLDSLDLTDEERKELQHRANLKRWYKFKMIDEDIVNVTGANVCVDPSCIAPKKTSKKDRVNTLFVTRFGSEFGDDFGAKSLKKFIKDNSEG